MSALPASAGFFAGSGAEINRRADCASVGTKEVGRGSNPFFFDHDAILASPRDANAPLLRRCAALIEAPERVPVPLAPVPLVWEIAGFGRESLDLEALRPFLTDATLKAACRRHLAQRGPHTLRGARYRQVAAPG